jgi:putative pyruvate formate lyase activating enzyme
MSSSGRLYVIGNKVMIADPREQDLPLVKRFWPDFAIQSVRPEDDFVPQLRRTINSGVIEDKLRLAQQALAACSLCARRCGVNRYQGSGFCGLKSEAYVIGSFNHIGEELPINTAWNVKLAGCSWHCCYCQSPEVFDIALAEKEGAVLDERLWGSISWQSSNTLELINPNESLPAIIKFLSHAPKYFNLPIVSNDNMYGSREAYYLADGLVDVYLPDLRYWSEGCARRLSGVSNYQKAVNEAIEAMVSQNARVIVRLLVLPNHLECCHRPALEWLSRYRSRVWVSILDQYIPQYRAAEHKDISRLTSREEIKEVEQLVRQLGLRDVNKNPEGFWK